MITPWSPTSKIHTENNVKTATSCHCKKVQESHKSLNANHLYTNHGTTTILSLPSTTTLIPSTIFEYANHSNHSPTSSSTSFLSIIHPPTSLRVPPPSLVAITPAPTKQTNHQHNGRFHFSTQHSICSIKTVKSYFNPKKVMPKYNATSIKQPSPQLYHRNQPFNGNKNGNRNHNNQPSTNQWDNNKDLTRKKILEVKNHNHHQLTPQFKHWHPQKCQAKIILNNNKLKSPSPPSSYSSSIPPKSHNALLLKDHYNYKTVDIITCAMAAPNPSRSQKCAWLRSQLLYQTTKSFPRSEDPTNIIKTTMFCPSEVLFWKIHWCRTTRQQRQQR